MSSVQSYDGKGVDTFVAPLRLPLVADDDNDKNEENSAKHLNVTTKADLPYCIYSYFTIIFTAYLG